MLASLMKNKVAVVHILTVAAGVLAYLAGSDVVAQYPELSTLAVSALGVVNFVLHIFEPDAPAASK